MANGHRFNTGPRGVPSSEIVQRAGENRTAQHRGVGPAPNPMPSRRARLERMPDRPAMVDSGGRAGMERQSPISYRLIFSNEGVEMTDERTGDNLPPEGIKTVITTVLQAPNLQEESQEDNWVGPVEPVGKVDVSMEHGPKLEQDRRPTINYTEGQGIPSTRDAVMKTSPLQASPQFREGPENMRLAPRVEDVKLPKLRRKRGGKAKLKMKKYAKGGGIRKPKYS